MSKAREQLAATLINHVHVIEYSLAVGRRSRRPTSKRYAEVSTLDYTDTAAFNETIKSFTAFNSKHFIENLRFLTDKLVGNISGLKVIWSPKILIRGLGGKIVAEDVRFDLATAVLQAMNFSGQSEEVLKALEFIGSINLYDGNHISTDVLIPAFKNTPFPNLAREQEDFVKILAARLLVMQAISYVVSGLSADQRSEIVNGRAYVKVNCAADQQQVYPIAFALEETEGVRAQRIARERLEELRRRRKVNIRSIAANDTQITYDVSPNTSPDEHFQLTVGMDTLFGW